MKIIVFVEGGIVQTVMTDEKAEVMIVDYDVEGSDPPERLITLDGDEAYVYKFGVYELNPYRVEEIFALHKASEAPKSEQFCPECHQAWVVHDGDGSCIID